MRNRLFFLLGFGACGAFAWACSSSPADDDGGTDSSASDSTTSDSAAKDVTTTDSTTKDSGTDSPITMDSGNDGSSTFTLTVRDYLDWCSVKVNNGTASTSDPQTYPGFAYDASVALNGVSASDASFYWGYWQGPGIGDGGENLNQNVTLTITGDVTVHACCPDNGQPLTQCTF